MDSQAIATEVAAPACKPAYRRLTNADRAYILKLRDQKFTQAEIAQRIGCTQQTVSDWLRQCQDTTSEASTYLRGSALNMARKIVSKGKASDLVATLKGINVLENTERQDFTLSINGVVLHGIAQAKPEAKVADAHVLEGEISEKANE